MPVVTFESIVREAAPGERHVLCGSRFTTAFAYGGESFVESHEHGGLYVNERHFGPGEIREYISDDFRDKINALEKAWLYGMAITDEGIPACIDECQDLLLDRDPFFCRDFMITYLGKIGYSPACQNLREAMLHDLRWEIRSSSAEALGEIGDKNYTGDLIGVANGNDHPAVSNSALGALGKMKDESALPALREMMRDGKRDFHLGCLTHDHDLMNKGQERIRQISGTLYRIGGNALHILSEALGDEDFWVRWSAGKGVEYSRLD
jgi:HEAT repeat protein